MSFGVPDWLKEIQSRDDFAAFDRRATGHMRDLWGKRARTNKRVGGQWGLGTGKVQRFDYNRPNDRTNGPKFGYHPDSYRYFGDTAKTYGDWRKGTQVSKRWRDAPDRWDVNKWGANIEHWKWLYDNHEKGSQGVGVVFPWEWQGQKRLAGPDNFTRKGIKYKGHLDRIRPVTPQTPISKKPKPQIRRPRTRGRTFRPQEFSSAPEQQKRFSPLR